jgi:hypothetical protein
LCTKDIRTIVTNYPIVQQAFDGFEKEDNMLSLLETAEEAAFV